MNGKCRIDHASKRSALHRQTIKIDLPIAFNDSFERVIFQIVARVRKTILTQYAFTWDTVQYSSPQSPLRAKRCIFGVDVSISVVGCALWSPNVHLAMTRKSPSHGGCYGVQCKQMADGNTFSLNLIDSLSLSPSGYLQTVPCYGHLRHQALATWTPFGGF